ncbi:HAD family hydrolase [Neobacillus mesonae]|uniref:HAD family hydrolase n=1 Tax=Neobacillus mesonae TaxID=1193713 RepID=UPI00203DB965|nr:HAD family hydrolase [Neobacillus mesonae]MCM3568562.1 HAD family hydrolase [Neobacillus mesonae]
MKIKAIFFDLDDTLHDHQAPFMHTIRETFQTLEALPDDTIYKRFRHYSDLLWVDYSSRKMSLESMRIKRIMLTLESFGCTISEEEARLFQKTYEYNLKHLRLFSDVPELFHRLRHNGMELGIITNGPVSHQRNKIDRLGLTQFISEDLIFISDEVGVAKPNPEIFHTASEKVGHHGENLIYVGDSWENDVVGSLAAGWNAVWFNYRGRKPDTDDKPLAVITELSELMDVLRGYSILE